MHGRKGSKVGLTTAFRIGCRAGIRYPNDLNLGPQYWTDTLYRAYDFGVEFGRIISLGASRIGGHVR